MVLVAVAQQQPQVDRVEPHRAHALVLRPVGHLVAAQLLVGEAFGADVDAPRRQGDAVVAGEAQVEPDEARGGAGGHGEEVKLDTRR